MLRLIHNRTINSPILVDDLDDGLPNKQTHRLGSSGDPNAYKRDGYANYPKQPCYIPYALNTDPNFPNLPGYIDLQETGRVTHSAGKGKIKKLVDAGLITVIDFADADELDWTPQLNAAYLNNPFGGFTVVGGYALTSLPPYQTQLVLSNGVNSVTIPQSQFLSSEGAYIQFGYLVFPNSFYDAIGGPILLTTTLTVIRNGTLANDGSMDQPRTSNTVVLLT